MRTKRQSTRSLLRFRRWLNRVGPTNYSQRQRIPKAPRTNIERRRMERVQHLFRSEIASIDEWEQNVRRSLEPFVFSAPHTIPDRLFDEVQHCAHRVTAALVKEAAPGLFIELEACINRMERERVVQSLGAPFADVADALEQYLDERHRILIRDYYHHEKIQQKT